MPSQKTGYPPEEGWTYFVETDDIGPYTDIGNQIHFIFEGGIQDSNLNPRRMAGIQDSDLVFKGPLS